MRLVFFGTSLFTLPSLEAILKGPHQVLAVVTQPDRKKGRSLSLSSPPVKTLALKHNLKVEQPLKISSPDFAAALKNYNADLFIVIAFGQILNKALLDLPKLYCLNLHASLLPKYRGAAPVNWAIINGEAKSGVSIIKMDEKIDHGDIILKKEIAVEASDNALTLSEKLSNLGAAALNEALNSIEEGKSRFYPQDEKEATFAPKLEKSDGLINWSQQAVNIHNKVRGLFPWPGAFTHLEGKILKVLETEVLLSEKNSQDIPGTIIGINKQGFVVQAEEGVLLIKQLQLEGSKPMSAQEFNLGRRIKTGTKLL